MSSFFYSTLYLFGAPVSVPALFLFLMRIGLPTTCIPLSRQLEMPPLWETKTAQLPALTNQLPDCLITFVIQPMKSRQITLHLILGELILADDDIPVFNFFLLLQGLILLTPQPSLLNRPATWSLTYSACPASPGTAGKTETEKEFSTEPRLTLETVIPLEKLQTIQLL